MADPGPAQKAAVHAAHHHRVPLWFGYSSALSGRCGPFGTDGERGAELRPGLHQHAHRRRVLLRLSVCHGHHALHQQLHHHAAADHCHSAPGAPCERGRGGPQEDCHHHPLCHCGAGPDPGRGVLLLPADQRHCGLYRRLCRRVCGRGHCADLYGRHRPDHVDGRADQ